MTIRGLCLALALSMVSYMGAVCAVAQGTVFTYQGRLNSGSSAFTGVAEFQVTLWDAASGGTQVAANNPAAVIVNLTNGLFVLPLDFGNAPFAAGADRWLEIQLRTTIGPYTTLTPRQKLTPTPYALRAANAATATTANSVAAANITGTLSATQLPPTLLTNNASGANLAGTFSGDGGGLTNLSMNQLGLTSSNVSIATWGRNDIGQRIVPPGLDNVVSVSPGAIHSLALLANGTVVAWGAGTTNSTNDIAHSGQSMVPAGLANVTAISAGYVHSLALRANGTMVAWGYNSDGQGSVPPALNNNIAAISAAFIHNLALKTDGTVIGWGSNNLGSLDIPAGLNNVTAVSAGIYHGVALQADGTVRIWGGNQYDQTNMPPGLTGIMAISAGGAHTLALRSNGTVVAWGAGSLTNDPSTGAHFGQSMVPPGLSNVVAIAAGYVRSLALKSDGTVVGWGGEEYGANVPSGLNNVVALGNGSIGVHGLALRKRFDAPVAVLDADNTFNGSLQVNGDGRFSGELTAGDLRLNDGTLWLRGGLDQNSGLGWYGPEKIFSFGAQLDGPVLFGNRAGALGTKGTNFEQIALFWNDQRRVGIGTTTPSAQLSLGGTPGPSKFLVYDNGSRGTGIGGNSSQLSFHLDGGGRFSFMSTPTGTEVATILSSGNVGIGNTAPTAKLDVRGDIRFGSTGQYSPAGGTENLRIVRGVVTAAGGIITGSGFTVSKGAAGLYTITFTPGFNGAPTVTCSTESQGGLSRVAMTDGVTSSVAVIRVTGSATGASTDAPFHFIAIGPR